MFFSFFTLTIVTTDRQIELIKERKGKERKEKAKSTAEFATKNINLRFRLTEKISALKRASNNNNNNNR